MAGAIGVKVAMESNSVRIDVQGNEQRDSPVNRDSKNLNNSEVWVDRRTLVKVAAGVNGYENERWYTAGLLEVGGYLATSEAARASGWRRAARRRSRAASWSRGRARTSTCRTGRAGRPSARAGCAARTAACELSRAPGDLLYRPAKGFEQKHERWGERATRTFYNPLIAPCQRYESVTPWAAMQANCWCPRNAALQGALMTERVYQGPRQTDAAARPGRFLSIADRDGATRTIGRGPVSAALRYGDEPSRLGLVGHKPAGDGRAGEAADGEIVLDAAWLNQAGLGALKLAGAERVVVQQALRLAPGGEAVLYAPWVAIDADLSAPGGRIQAGNVLKQMSAQRPRRGGRGSARVWTGGRDQPGADAARLGADGLASRRLGRVAQQRRRALTQSGSINVSSGAGRSWAGVLRAARAATSRWRPTPWATPRAAC